MTDTTTELVPASGDGTRGELASAGAIALADGTPDAHHDHATPRQYVLIAVILAIITAIEIGVSYVPDEVPQWVMIVMLLFLAGIKFFMVAAWFMHLRFDNKVLRRLFITGLVAAPILYLIALSSLHVFST
jgi:cytochrome c oxidase subunit IV